jgi:hypothetical protein
MRRPAIRQPGRRGRLRRLNDDLRLAAGSPMIDAGRNSAVLVDYVDLDNDGDTFERTPRDLDRNARNVDDPYSPNTGLGPVPFVVRGAYEYQACGGYRSCTGDADGDNAVGNADLQRVLEAWASSSGDVHFDGSVDFDCDGQVGNADLQVVLEHWAGNRD